ncbi:hypothetical protein Tco_0039692 [Tanacetum coccineum]
MASMNTRLNIEKLDKNSVQKHAGSKQIGFKQLSPKQVGFYGDSNNDVAVAQRKLEVKQFEEKTNMGCFVKEREKECAVSSKAILQHVMVLLTTEAEYMTLTVELKDDTFLKGLSRESGFELGLVAG